MTAPRRMAIVCSSSVFLERLLQLPEGTQIVGAEWHMPTSEIRLALEGIWLPLCQPHHVMLEVKPAVRTVDGVTTIEWPIA